MAYHTSSLVKISSAFISPAKTVVLLL